MARLARDADDIVAAERLRYAVFVTEMGGDGPGVDHAARRERDGYDPHCDHLVLVDTRRDPAGRDHVVGVYRLLPGARAARAGGFYSEGEYDLAPLLAPGRRLLELGRSCLHPDHRGGAAMPLLWQALAAHVADHGVEILFGVASFPGTDLAALAAPLTVLHRRHLAPEHLRARARSDGYQRMDLVPEGALDRIAAMRAVPALIKAYLRMGGAVGDGAFVDRAFNTTDVFMVLDVATQRPDAARRLARARP